MRLVRAAIVLLFFSLTAGCGFIHFGRAPKPVAGDSAVAEAYTSLSTEHKILKQELVLARKEGDALRVALDRAGGGGLGTASNPPRDLTAQLNETARELATLRASYAKLQAEKTSAPPAADLAANNAAKAELEDKLANTLRSYTELQAENTRLRADLAQARSENAGLAEQLKVAASQAEQAQSAYSQLNTDLLAQKEARSRAEQASESLRTQLSAVMAHAPGATPPASRETTTSPMATLQIAKAPPADSSPTAELRANAERLRATGDPVSSATTTTPKPPRTHVVQAGETLEQIARRYYGTPDRWRAVYDANAALLGNGQPLQVGMELKVPEN